MLRILAALLAICFSAPASADEFAQPRKIASAVDWQAAAGGAEPADVFSKLNEVFSERYPAIGKSGVPVLLPVDVAAATKAKADASPFPPPTGGFRQSRIFVAGAAGYQAVYFIDPSTVAGVRYARPVEITITGAAFVYEPDGPAFAEDETQPKGYDDFPGMRRILRESHLRYAFTRFGVPYVVSLECFNGRVTGRRLACRDGDLIATRFLRALNVAGGTPMTPREPKPVDIARPEIASTLFTYYPPGTLIPNSGYKTNAGRGDRTVYAHIRFPIAEAPSYAKSQSFSSWGDCYRKGKVGRTGSKGAEYRCRLNQKQLVFDENAPENFSYPWRDNFCETRDTQVGQCPAGFGHQGQDLRPSSCVLRNEFADRCLPYQHDVVAVRDGTIWRNSPSDVIYETVYIIADADNDLVRFRYMHLNPKQMDADGLLSGKRVREGDVIGKVADYYKKEHGTSYHLHFDTQVFTRDGWIWVNPYMTLVSAYERLIGARGTQVAESEVVAPPPAPVVEKRPESPKLSAKPKSKAAKVAKASKTKPKKAVQRKKKR